MRTSRARRPRPQSAAPIEDVNVLVDAASVQEAFGHRAHAFETQALVQVDGAFVAGHHRIELQAAEPQRRRLGKRVLHQRAPDPATARLGNHGVARVGHVPQRPTLFGCRMYIPRTADVAAASAATAPSASAAARTATPQCDWDAKNSRARSSFSGSVWRERVARLHDPVPCPQHAREVFFAIRADEKGCGRPLIGLSRAHVSSIRRFSRCTHKA